jgi:hypothetical protein
MLQKSLERDIALELGAVDGALRVRERIDAAKTPARRLALLTHGIDSDEAGALEERVRYLRFAVDELCAELHRNFEARNAPRPAASADAVTRFEDQHAGAFARELIGRGEPGRARADNYDIGLKLP